jgi:hypothetical protein
MAARGLERGLDDRDTLLCLRETAMKRPILTARE